MTLVTENLADDYLLLVQEIASDFDLRFRIIVGVQLGGASLNFKVYFDEVRLLPDFNIFALIPNDPREANDTIRIEFAKYLSRIAWRG